MTHPMQRADRTLLALRRPMYRTTQLPVAMASHTRAKMSQERPGVDHPFRGIAGPLLGMTRPLHRMARPPLGMGPGLTGVGHPLQGPAHPASKLALPVLPVAGLPPAAGGSLRAAAVGVRGPLHTSARRVGWRSFSRRRPRCQFRDPSQVQENLAQTRLHRKRGTGKLP